MEDCELLEWTLDEGMVVWLLDEILVEDDFVGLALVAVDACVMHAGVTVTVTVDFGQLLQSTAH